MSTELIVPTLGESITEATVSKWLINIGDSFEADQPLVEIETDKITVEVPAPHAGSLKEIKVKEGTDINIGGILGILDESKGDKLSSPKIKKQNNEVKPNIEKEKKENPQVDANSNKSSPSARKMAEENNISIQDIKSSRSDGRINKEDVVKHINSSGKDSRTSSEREEIVKMSKIRQTISKRLKEAQNTAAILTTFNEVDMSQIMEIRNSKNKEFQERYEVKLGFMSFFVKAVTESLKEFPAVNAEIKDENIIYKNHFDIGIAVGTEKGLVVPVLKDADTMNFGQIEKSIIELSTKAKDGTLSMDDLSGGTFTISSLGGLGGTQFTPIINAPEVGILGLSRSEQKPIWSGDAFLPRLMLPLSLSYDHRVIDGAEGVRFLNQFKLSLSELIKELQG